MVARYVIAVALTAILTTPARGEVDTATPTEVRKAVSAYRSVNELAVINEFKALLSIPNVASDIPAIDRNAEYLTAQLKKRGFKVELLRAKPGTPSSVFAELAAPGAKRSLTFYAHFDGQPATQTGWRSQPWTPVVRKGADARTAVDVQPGEKPADDWRIYARSASDDKGPIQALFTSLDALKAAGKPLNVNLKVMLEGEEEAGSNNLQAILDANRAKLRSDVMVLADGPRHQSGRVQVFLGARGVMGLDVTVYGPSRPLHSGHYGNWAPNAGVMISHLLASLRDEQGNVLVDGFYDRLDKMSPEMQQLLNKLPPVEKELIDELAIGRTEFAGRLGDAISRPALNVTGIRIGDVGVNGANVILPSAQATIDFRLAPGQQMERVRDQVEAHLRRQGWHLVTSDPAPDVRRAHPKVAKVEWSFSYPGYRADLASPASRKIVDIVSEMSPDEPVIYPMLGGSIPIALFAHTLDMPVIGVSIVNYDNNQHGANENLRLADFWDGVAIYAALLSAK